jgi:glucokinase
VAVVDPSGAVRSKRVVPTPADDPGMLARTLRSVLDSSEEAITAAVVGVPGPVDYSRGEVLRLPNLPAWDGKISAAGLGKELGLPVFLANDADLATLGEQRFGAGRGSRDVVYVTSSTGVGAGVVLDGRLVRGRLSVAEVGHTIIDRQTSETVEDLGSGTALKRLSGQDPASVAARAAGGADDAIEQFAAVARDFAIGVFNLAHLFSPEVIIIGGGMSEAGELLLGPVVDRLATCKARCPALRTRVVKATGGDDVGLKGAAAYWADQQLPSMT